MTVKTTGIGDVLRTSVCAERVIVRSLRPCREVVEIFCYRTCCRSRRCQCRYLRGFWLIRTSKFLGNATMISRNGLTQRGTRRDSLYSGTVRNWDDCHRIAVVPLHKAITELDSISKCEANSLRQKMHAFPTRFRPLAAAYHVCLSRLMNCVLSREPVTYVFWRAPHDHKP